METINLEVQNLVNYAKAAEILGVSRPTIYNMVKTKNLHPVSIGKSKYLLKEEIERIKKERKNATQTAT